MDPDCKVFRCVMARDGYNIFAQGSGGTVRHRCCVSDFGRYQLERFRVQGRGFHSDAISSDQSLVIPERESRSSNNGSRPREPKTKPWRILRCRLGTGDTPSRNETRVGSLLVASTVADHFSMRRPRQPLEKLLENRGHTGAMIWK